MTGRPINKDRIDALALGLPYYVGEPHKNCGETLRYTSGAGCVRCARLRSVEQRDRARFLKLTCDDVIQEQIDDHDEFAPPIEPDPVDIEPDDSVEPDDVDDAQAREAAGIDELM